MMDPPPPHTIAPLSHLPQPGDDGLLAGTALARQGLQRRPGRRHEEADRRQQAALLGPPVAARITAGSCGADGAAMRAGLLRARPEIASIRKKSGADGLGFEDHRKHDNP